MFLLLLSLSIAQKKKAMKPSFVRQMALLARSPKKERNRDMKLRISRIGLFANRPREKNRVLSLLATRSNKPFEPLTHFFIFLNETFLFTSMI